MVDYLITRHEEGGGVIAYIYRDYRGQTNQTVVNILGSLLHQLLIAVPRVPAGITALLA